MPNLTTFSHNPDIVGQFIGTPNAPVYAPTYAATILLDVQNNSGAIINGVNATSATTTLNASTGGYALQRFSVMVKDTGGVTATFGTNFKPSATANPTTGKAITVHFMSDGTNFVETGRNAAAVTY